MEKWYNFYQLKFVSWKATRWIWRTEQTTHRTGKQKTICSFSFRLSGRHRWWSHANNDERSQVDIHLFKVVRSQQLKVTSTSHKLDQWMMGFSMGKSIISANNMLLEDGSTTSVKYNISKEEDQGHISNRILTFHMCNFINYDYKSQTPLL